jgi:two-component system response regulator YesN
MYKILLAEDENLIRSHIIHLIHTYMQEFVVSVEASSGEEAMVSLDQEEPDILLTDIRMPGANGLQLIRYAKERYPDLPCIVLTGYQEFELVREALQLGSLGYLLKPVTSNELIEVLHRAVSTRKKSNTYAALFPQFEMEPYFLKALEGDDEDIHCFAEKAKEYIPFTLENEPKAILAVDDHVSRQRLLEAVSSKKGIVFGTRYLVFAVIITLPPGWTHDKLRDDIQKMSLVMVQGHEKPPAIGISSFFYKWEEAPHKYQEAFQHYAPRFYRGNHWIAGPTDVGHYVIKFNGLNSEAQLIIDKLENMFHSGAFTEVERSIHEWFDTVVLEAWFITDVHTFCSRLLRRLLNVYSNDQLELMGLQSWNAMQWVTKRRTVEALRNDLLGFLNGIVVQTQHYSGNIQSIVAKVQAIIDRDYGMPELSILGLAKELYISSSHLSTVFKKKTGKPFSQYLTDLRMEKARQLLHEDRLKSYEVAAAIGYCNEKAFSRAFRRKFGVSPQNYKKQSGLL